LNTETRGEKMKIRIEQHTFMGTVWIGAWLFTIGFLNLEFWKGGLALVVAVLSRFPLQLVGALIHDCIDESQRAS
jgi:hypothetical protein